MTNSVDLNRMIREVDALSHTKDRHTGPHRILVRMSFQSYLPVSLLDLFLSLFSIPSEAQDFVGLLF